MERMLDEKQIRVIVLFDFKMRHKAAETTCNINNPSGPGTANARTVQWCFKKYAKEMRALKMRTVRAGHRKLQWWTEKIIKADPLTTAEVTEELSVDHSTVIPHLKGSGKVKRLCKWVPYELTENFKKTVFLKCHLLLLYATHHFSIGLWHVMKGRFIWQPATTSSVAGLRRSSEALLKAKLTPKKGHGQIQKKKKVTVTVWWSAARLIHYNFLNHGETITSEKYVQQIDEMHWKLQRLQAALVNWKGPILHDTRPHAAQAVLQKLNQLGYEVLPYLPYSPNLSPTDYNFFKHLDNILQGKCFPQEFV